MFCIKSDVITLGFIEMYGFVTVWMSMYDGLYWVILLMCGSHDMRYTGFLQVDGGQRDPRVGASHKYSSLSFIIFFQIRLHFIQYISLS